MRIFESVRQFSASLRLVGIALAGAVVMVTWVLQQEGSPWLTRLWGAALAACAPLVAALPFVVRAVRRAARSRDELATLRRAGAI